MYQYIVCTHESEDIERTTQIAYVGVNPSNLSLP